MVIGPQKSPSAYQFHIFDRKFTDMLPCVFCYIYCFIVEEILSKFSHSSALLLHEDGWIAGGKTVSSSVIHLYMHWAGITMRVRTQCCCQWQYFLCADCIIHSDLSAVFSDHYTQTAMAIARVQRPLRVDLRSTLFCPTVDIGCLCLYLYSVIKYEYN